MAEDDEPIAETIALLLEEAGYRVMWVPNGHEALEAARRHWPSLVLTDLMMPRMGGEALIEALRTLAAAEHRPMPPVVLLTAADLTAHQAEALGATAVVRKPFDIRDLEALVTRLAEGLPTQ
jgi:CheY-like chemotaxis protein